MPLSARTFKHRTCRQPEFAAKRDPLLSACSMPRLLYPRRMHDDRPRLAPVLATLVAIALFSIMDAAMKHAAIVAGVYPALLCRSVVGAGLVFPLWRARGGCMPGAPVLRLHVYRGVVVAAMAASFFWGLVRLPMAEGIALSFISPLIALWLAARHLGERIRRDAVVAALLGLSGVLVIGLDRFGASSSGPEAGAGMAAILLSACFYAINLILQRQQALITSPLEVALFQNAVVALVLLPGAPLLWQTPPAESLPWIGGAAFLASAALALLGWSYARAEAQVLVPLEYTAFGWAALMGWLWFGETTGPATLAGVALIVAGCLIGSRTAPVPAVTPPA